MRTLDLHAPGRPAFAAVTLTDAGTGIHTARVTLPGTEHPDYTGFSAREAFWKAYGAVLAAVDTLEIAVRPQGVAEPLAADVQEEVRSFLSDLTNGTADSTIPDRAAALLQRFPGASTVAPAASTPTPEGPDLDAEARNLAAGVDALTRAVLDDTIPGAVTEWARALHRLDTKAAEKALGPVARVRKLAETLLDSPLLAAYREGKGPKRARR